MTGALVCDQTPLYQLVDKLNEVYKVRIEIANTKLRDLPITTTFKNQSLDEILKVITETFNISVERQGNRFLLK
jgi:ferric-dicitrate binding protein FerR (iron transport regulator)